MLNGDAVLSVFCQLYVREGAPTPEGASHEAVGMTGAQIPGTWRPHRVKMKVPGYKPAFPFTWTLVACLEESLSSHSQRLQCFRLPSPAEDIVWWVVLFFFFLIWWFFFFLKKCSFSTDPQISVIVWWVETTLYQTSCDMIHNHFSHSVSSELHSGLLLAFKGVFNLHVAFFFL